MSSILKALKKVEDEKAARQGQRVDITKDIFGASQQTSRSSRWPLAAAGVVVASALGVVATLLIARPDNVPAPAQPSSAAPSPPAAPLSPQNPAAAGVTGPESRVPSPAPPPSPHPPVAAAPLLPHPVQKAGLIGSKPATPAAVSRTGGAIPATPRSVPVRPAQGATPAGVPAPSSVPVLTADRPTIAPLPSPSQQAKPAGAGAAALPAASAATTLPRITVSGVAYNKEPADRLAVVNGVPAGEGKTISGVTVEEILPDRVRFSFGQKSFEVQVGRSSQ